MCKKLLMLVCVLSVVGIASAAAPTTWTEIGYWSFDNTADLTANSYGVVANNYGVTPGAGISNGGATFASSNLGTERLFIGGGNAAWLQQLKSTRIMYDFWTYLVAADGAGTYESLAFHSQQSGGSSSVPMATLVDMHGGVDGQIFLNGDNNYQMIESTTTSYWNNTMLDKWAHVQVVYTDNVFEIYLNDVLFVGDNHHGMYGGPSGGITGTIDWSAIGSRTYGGSSVIGNLDEFRIFIPEPITIALLGLGGLFLRRRKTA